MSPRLPQVTPKEVITALKRAGFREARQKGSHLALVHDEKNLQATVPIHPGDLHRSLLKAILKQSGLNESEFRDLL
jgi:predicted RNA binding protein YcfA (HicA-like mRNA interferase family)